MRSEPSRTRSPDVSSPRPPKSGGMESVEAKFHPLETLPDDVPRSYRRRWERLATTAASSYRAAVELKCLDCCAWQRAEAKHCEITGCPLWALSSRIFDRDGRTPS